MGAVRPPYLLTVEDLPRFARPDRRLELVDGHLFVSSIETPYLDRVIANAEQVLRRALARRSDTDVRVNDALQFNERNLLVPDVSVARKGAQMPGLVLEVRTDSTDRYALGPKRMVYSRCRIPEYWFLDPRAEDLVVCRLNANAPDYPWPPAHHGRGDTVSSTAFAGLTVAVRELLVPEREQP